MRFVLSIIVLFFTLNQAIGQTYTGDQKEINKILKNAENFSKYIVAADYDKITAAYTKDGKIFPNNKEIIEGHELIRKYWVLPEGYQTLSHKVTPSEIKIIGDEAYDYGHYKGSSKGPDGREVSWKGKYVIVWKKVDGDWKMYLDIWNSIQD